MLCTFQLLRKAEKVVLRLNAKHSPPFPDQLYQVGLNVGEVNDHLPRAVPHEAETHQLPKDNEALQRRLFVYRLCRQCARIMNTAVAEGQSYHQFHLLIEIDLMDWR